MKYLKNKTWSQITREERLFCAELFFEIRKDQKLFLELIGKDKKDYEIAYESCFYRDVLHAYGISIKSTNLPKKRTFDLALFSEDEIIIIEAKAKQGFDSEQLETFEKDKENLRKLFEIIDVKLPKIETIAICSSKYRPKESSIKDFSKVVRWSEIAEIYKDSSEMFNRADSVYNDQYAK